MKQYRPTNELHKNMKLPILFIMAKTFGAAKEFGMDYELERKLNGQVRNIVWLYKSVQLRGLRSSDVRVVAIPRYDEYEHNLQLEKMLRERSMPILHAVRFLDNLKNNIPI